MVGFCDLPKATERVADLRLHPGRVGTEPSPLLMKRSLSHSPGSQGLFMSSCIEVRNVQPCRGFL